MSKRMAIALLRLDAFKMQHMTVMTDALTTGDPGAAFLADLMREMYERRN